MVQFDRLKPCHQEVQIQEKENHPQKQVNPLSPPGQSKLQPPGTTLQLVEDDDTGPAQEEINTPEISNQRQHR